MNATVGAGTACGATCARAPLLKSRSGRTPARSTTRKPRPRASCSMAPPPATPLSCAGWSPITTRSRLPRSQAPIDSPSTYRRGRRSACSRCTGARTAPPSSRPCASRRRPARNSRSSSARRGARSPACPREGAPVRRGARLLAAHTCGCRWRSTPMTGVEHARSRRGRDVPSTRAWWCAGAGACAQRRCRGARRGGAGRPREASEGAVAPLRPGPLGATASGQEGGRTGADPVHVAHRRSGSPEILGSRRHRRGGAGGARQRE